ncbi:MAG: O-fucosyltransferase family protein [Burkholderiales bacterium]
MASETPTPDGDNRAQAAEYAEAADDFMQHRRRRDIAELLARNALQLDPGNARARRLLEELARTLQRPAAASSGARYLLVREWSQGFWSDVDHVLGMCLLAEISHRTPIAWWGAQSRFSGDAAGNAWDRFFEPVSGATLRELDAPELRRFPAKWDDASLAGPIRQRWTGDGSRLASIELLDRDEEVVVSDFHSNLNAILPWLPASHALAGAPLPEAYRALVRKYLRPRPPIAAEVERFAAAHFGGGPLVAVHVRGSDKIEEVSDLEATLRAYFEPLDEKLRAHSDARIFLLTDDERVRAFYGERYGGRVLATPCTRATSNVGVHYLAGRDPVRTGVEVMVDAYLAARCGAFIGLGYSNVSLYVSYLKAWPPGACVLLGANAHEVWNALPLLMDAPPGAD